MIIPRIEFTVLSKPLHINQILIIGFLLFLLFHGSTKCTAERFHSFKSNQRDWESDIFRHKKVM